MWGRPPRPSAERSEASSVARALRSAGQAQPATAARSDKLMGRQKPTASPATTPAPEAVQSASPRGHRSPEGEPARRLRAGRPGAGRDPAGNRGVPFGPRGARHRGRGFARRPSRPGMSRIPSRIVPPARRSCARIRQGRPSRRYGMSASCRTSRTLTPGEDEPSPTPTTRPSGRAAGAMPSGDSAG